MKKLLFVISQLYKGGAEMSLVNLINRLDPEKYAVELVILNQCPVENAVSLTSRIHKNIRVCDAYAEYQRATLFSRARARYYYTPEQKGAYLFPALDFVRNKVYDWAFFVGEWILPSFVAYEVNAKVKAAWIHNDLSEAEYFDGEAYFYFLDCFDYFIFVSENSLRASVEKYPFLKDRSVCIYNINDVDLIRGKAQEGAADFPKTNLPVLVTCANFRLQKAHVRQVKVMAELKRRGIEVVWLNIGATTEKRLVRKVERLCELEGLDKQFFILGPKDNPYAYIRQADAVTVLSDYESWSMVITEAKIIGTPVIATKTSGAQEQIEHRKTGVLTGFEIVEIADEIEKFIKDKSLRETIKDNISNFDDSNKILEEFYNLLETGSSYHERKIKEGNGEPILYIIDDINYLGGAHIATKLQIKEWRKRGRMVAVFASNVPCNKIREELKGVEFLSWKQFPADVLFQRRLMEVLTNRNISKKEKWEKVRHSVRSRLRSKNYYSEYVLPELSGLISRYPIVCVMSEGSTFRKQAALADCKKKIQWIHINYCDWKDKSEWNKKITADDGELYKNFDCIVFLSEGIRNDFCDLYPHLKSKTYINRNLMPVEEIQNKVRAECFKNMEPVKFVTVGRVDYQKAYVRLIRVLARLRDEHYNFRWTIIGDGDEYKAIDELVRKYHLGEWVYLTGAMDNPFPEMLKADVFALLSDFEGLPNTIYEALILGLPVLATDVGGVDTQIEDMVNGWLVENTEKAIEKKLQWLLMNGEKILEVRENNKSYHYDNSEVMRNNDMIFFVQ